MNKAVFLDRDGIINEVVMRGEIVGSPRFFSEFKIISEIAAFINHLRNKGYLVIVFTNQPDIERGLLEVDALEAMHEVVRTHLLVHDIFYCPHVSEQGCGCRKPKPGMLVSAAQKWDIDLSASYVIGDLWKDIEAGRAVSCLTIYLKTPYNTAADATNYCVTNIQDMYSIIQ